MFAGRRLPPLRLWLLVGGCAAVVAVFLRWIGSSTDNAALTQGWWTVPAALTPLVTWLVDRWERRREAPATSTGDQVDAAAELLAERVQVEWDREAAARGITRPGLPVRVAWQLAPGLPASGIGPARLLDGGVVTELHDEVFTELVPGRQLVLLGGPGAGKTAAMILLLRAALEHRRRLPPEQRRDAPVPVWLTVGSWDPHTQTVAEWVGEVLARDHDALDAPEYGPTAVERLLAGGRLVLCCDGLDELPARHRGRALQRLDTEARGMRVVLTSRPGEYTTAPTEHEVSPAAVLHLLPVDRVAAAEFLLSERSDADRGPWQRLVAALDSNPAPPAAAALTTPLALTLARDTYLPGREGNPAELADPARFPDPPAVRHHLLDRLLPVAYRDHPDQLDRDAYWLGWLAHHLGPNSYDLAWWRIPDYVPQWRLRVVIGLMAGVLTGPAFGLTVGVATGITFGVTTGLTVGVATGLTTGSVLGLIAAFDRVAPPKRLRFRLLRRDDGSTLAFGVALGLMTGVATVSAGLVIAVAIGLTVVVAFVVDQLWAAPPCRRGRPWAVGTSST